MAEKKVTPKDPKAKANKGEATKAVAAKTGRKSGRKNSGHTWSDRNMKGNVVPVEW